MSRSEETHTQLTDKRLLDIVRKSISLFEARMKKNDVVVSTGDLIRLLEIEARLSKRSGTQEVAVRWVSSEEELQDLLNV